MGGAHSGLSPPAVEEPGPSHGLGMIAIDWGTSSVRAWRLGPEGVAAEARAAPLGIMAVPDGDFAEAFTGLVGDWLAEGEGRALLSGMIGSRQGWREAPYLPCPADPALLAQQLLAVPFDGAEIRIVPGLVGADASGVPEVMRGEETQLLGLAHAIGGTGTVCLPGTHSKWATLKEGAIVGSTTHMTGEVFAALRSHTILGRLMSGPAGGGPAFADGVLRSGQPGGLLHHAFGARTLVLLDRMASDQAASYLSGLLIGHEVRSATEGLPAGAAVQLVGAAELCTHYGEALALLGFVAHGPEGDWALAGLRRIGEAIGWL